MKLLFSLLLLVAMFIAMFLFEFSLGFFRGVHFFFIHQYISESIIIVDASSAFMVSISFSVLFAFIMTLPIADNIFQRLMPRTVKGKPVLVSWKQSILSLLIFLTGVLAGFTWVMVIFNWGPTFVGQGFEVNLKSFILYINKRQWIVGLLCLIVWYAFVGGKKYRHA